MSHESSCPYSQKSLETQYPTLENVQSTNRVISNQPLRHPQHFPIPQHLPPPFLHPQFQQAPQFPQPPQVFLQQAQPFYSGQPNPFVIESNEMICGIPIPYVETTTAVVLLVLNLIFMPGLGTMLISCVGYGKRSGWGCLGLVQFFTAFCCVGWIWSIVTSIKVLNYSKKVQRQMLFPNNQQPVIGRPVN